ncbi:UDP-N-acetylmuramoyl-tripeptide--D-alanyl-D-alanine ligase [Acetonema longum]|uniref:UDP-N-acetylmuramoyl-tripeptide--D-alanyl-D-alanine ligase n=1 Tax=Acetonema longum DSM 6540 TaxID=1009370 RepID=F7NPZ1_9FIRM|nr:UDP-N-acetylmuramoyl-tripeptide--D-alanyl-D-alanine ligase [Acetonema longum]EGO61982.1 UDP-N-acetylmuramoyl-tripeptide--D-alanyl-D-alanine ligase [Acetonema longum DSM 6540]
MACFTLDEVCLATGGSIISDKPESKALLFASVSTDSRSIASGDLFIALQGETFDGHDYLSQARQKGAGGIIVSRRDASLPQDCPVILVQDTLKALQDLARFHRQKYSIPVIAVTGSNGKTTTKDMISAVLSVRFNVLKTEANYNNEIGLPLTLLRLQPEHEAVVVEMGMRGMEQIRALAQIALPNVAVITNVGETHIELLGSIENIAKAKAELVQAVAARGLVVLNGDDDRVAKMRDLTEARVIYYGLKPKAGVKAENIRTAASGVTFDSLTDGRKECIELPTYGVHNVYNALAAIAVGQSMGMTPEEIRQGLKNFTPSAMRLHIEKMGLYTVINDSYNASPLSMKAAINVLGDIAAGRAVAVLGDMLELGAHSAEAHRQIGLYLAEKQIKAVIGVGDQIQHTVRAAKESGVPETVFCQNHQQATDALGRLLMPGDTVLLKGSRSMKMERLLPVFNT